MIDDPAEVAVRPYESKDEEGVRRICFDTAFYGESMAPYFNEPHLVTEMLIGYHLRFEPESVLVAHCDAHVAGYLAGCADTARFLRIYWRRIMPELFLRFVIRAHGFRRRSIEALLAGYRNSRKWAKMRDTVIDLYPAHCHVNVDSAYRGAGIGKALLERFVKELGGRGVRGVHVSTQTENGKAFFAGAGFRILAEYTSPPLWDHPASPGWVMARGVD